MTEGGQCRNHIRIMKNFKIYKYYAVIHDFSSMICFKLAANLESVIKHSIGVTGV